MDKCIGMYYSEGDSFHETAFLRNDIFETGKSYYEVLRVIDNRCIFLADHLNRLNKSVQLSGLSYSLAYKTVSSIIHELLLRNNWVTGNIRLVLHVSTPASPVLYACCVPSTYPDGLQYEQGVSTAVFPKVRSNPNVKLYYPLFQQQILEFITSRNIFEALLANEAGLLTEGSKSNLFFIRGNIVYTAPGQEVLKGITRQKVILLCNKLKYKIIESAISIDTLINTEAVFLTGTSPKVLPVCKIDDLSFRVDHPMMRSLMTGYDGLIRRDAERSYAH